MVDLGKRRARGVEVMDSATERSRPLHNFDMSCLKWGNQKVLRCMIVDLDGKILSSDRRYSSLEIEKGLIGRGREIERVYRKESLKRSPEAEASVWGKSKAEEINGIDAVRMKLMFDLQAEADKMKDAILRKGSEDEEALQVQEPIWVEANGAARPWNLRAKRAVCKAQNRINAAICGGDGYSDDTINNGVVAKGLRVDERRKPKLSSFRNESESPTFGGDVNNAPAGEKRERAKFAVSLLRREIEDDFILVTGHKPPRRPKKRPKIVHKELDALFPGLWLTEVTADMYKVPDAPEN